jgi:homocitrate synthase NifV
LDHIDLWDETLREGAERSTFSLSLDEQLEMARQLSNAGIRTIVVGMFPHIPRNFDLLAGLLRYQGQRKIADDMEFVVIAHVGRDFFQTIESLKSVGHDMTRIRVLTIISTSDHQIEHLFKKVLETWPVPSRHDMDWESVSLVDKKKISLNWFDDFLDAAKAVAPCRMVIGLLDAFRCDFDHVVRLLKLAGKYNITSARLVDTAGTCVIEDVDHIVGGLVEAFPNFEFFGHFHNDFGMATSNAIRGLSLGLRGVDVSVGGVANRAGHPPIAEVVATLEDIYGYKRHGINLDRLFELSRYVERAYGLIECPTKPLTGIITHATQVGVRTKLVEKCNHIFDIIDSSKYGAKSVNFFGIRSGLDGIKAVVMEDGAPNFTKEDLEAIYNDLISLWTKKTLEAKLSALALIDEYQRTMIGSYISENDVRGVIEKRIGIGYAVME